MSARLKIGKVQPEAYKALNALDVYNSKSGIDKMQREGIATGKEDDEALMAASADQAASSGAAPASNNGGSEAERQAQVAANRARMAAMQGKK